MEGGTVLERLQVIIDAYTKPFRDEVEKVQQKTKQATSNVENQANKMGNAFKRVAKVVGVALGVTAIVAFGKSCIDLGSNLTEVQNVVDVTFGSMNSSVDSFAKNAIKQFGLSETAAKKYVGMYGTMAKQFGFTTQQAYDMSTGLAGAAGDVSSFYNITADEAYTKLKSVFSGETESLKDIGVVMTQNALDAYAMANGFGKTTSQMSEQEKVALRYQFVMAQLSAAQGDFTRTSGSWANQTRVLSLQFQSLKATIGQGLINAFTPVIQVINSVMAKMQVLATYFSSFTGALFGKQNVGSGIASSIADATQSAGTLTDNMGSAADSAKEAQSALMGFDEINKISDNSNSSSGVGVSGMGAYSLGTASTSNIIDTTGVDGAVSKMMKILEPLMNINFNPLKEAFGIVVKAAEPLGEKVFSGLEWVYKNVLVPIATWTIQDALPAFLKVFAGALDVLNSTLDALQPLWQWAWDSFLQPIASWTGGVVVDVLEGLAVALKGVSDWISNNQAVVKNIAIIVGSFATAWGLVNIAVGIWTVVCGIATAVTTAFGAAVAFVTSPIGLVILAIGALIAIGVLLYQNWDTVKAVAISVFTAVADFIGNICKNIGDFFVALWNGIVAVFSVVVDFYKGIFQAAFDAITTIFSFLGDVFFGYWNAVASVFSVVGNFFRNVFSDAWEGIKSIFSGVGSFFGGVWDTIVSLFTGIGSSIGNAIGGAFKFVVNSIIDFAENTINGFIWSINGAIGLINKIPGIDIPEIGYLNVPRLAKGGIVDQGQMFIAGEAGKEAIMPLENNTGWIDVLASRISGKIGGTPSKGNSTSLTLPIYIGGKQITTVVIDDINNITKSSGTCPIYI